MIFPVIRNEPIVQVNDRTRIDVSQTFLSPDEAAITLVEIQPTASDDFCDVTSTQFLDWVFSSSADVVVTVRITTDSTPVTATKSISVLSAAEDLLFSGDSDIITHEAEIYRFLRDGRSTFTDIHRVAQELILKDLEKRGITNSDGTKITKEDIYDIEEVKEWSKFLTLSLIFKSASNEVNDFFETKAGMYEKKAEMAANRYTIQLDQDQDDKVDSMPDLVSGRLVRR